METKRLYKVLIKGPWDGIKEEFQEVAQEALKEFGDEDNILRAICVYEKGEQKYNFVAKKLWEKWDEVGKIISNPNFSSEQRMEEIRKLLGG